MSQGVSRALAERRGRGGAGRTARARCVCSNINTLDNLPDNHTCGGQPAARVSQGISRERPIPRRRCRARDPGNRCIARTPVRIFFLVVASLVSLDASGPRRARARYSPSQPHTRRRDTAARSRRQRGPAAPLTRDTANGLALVGLFYWRWGAFDGPPPSKNAGSLR